MKPLIATMLMALLAFAAGMSAWYYYPRIEVAQGEVDRETLLPEDEAFEPRDVRKIRIEQYERDNNSRKEFELQFVDGGWVIPASNNYPADNLERVAKATNALREKKILEIVSDEKDDHEQYGVVDIEELGSARLGAGTVLTFEGRNRKRLGRLIVGSSPEGKPDQRYVRLAGQPQIYVIEFDQEILTTTFSDWVDGALIRIGGAQMKPEQFIGQIKSITVDLYFQDGDDATKKQPSYRSLIRQTSTGWFQDVWSPDENGVLPEQPTVTNQETERLPLSNLISTVFDVRPRNVIRKQDTASIDLADPKPTQPSSHFESLKGYGFYYRDFENGQHQFDSAAGEITISYQFGLETRVNIGSLDVDVASGGNINRFVVLSASVNPSLFPEPKKPGEGGESGGNDADESDADSAQEPDSDVEREYQAKVKQRNEVLAGAAQMATAYNQLHADWIYVLPEESIERLLPPQESWKKAAN